MDVTCRRRDKEPRDQRRILPFSPPPLLPLEPIFPSQFGADTISGRDERKA